MDEDADFTVRLVQEVTRPAREIQRALREATQALRTVDEALEGLNFQGLRKGQTEAEKLTAAFKKMDDAMAHQDWVHRKRREAFDQKQQGILEAAKLRKARMGGFDGAALAAGPVQTATLAIGAAALAAGAAEAYLAVQFAEATFSGARFAQTSIQALNQLTGVGAIAVTQFDAVRHEAVALGLDVEATMKGFQKLLAAQFEVGKARELVRMGADLQVIGATSEEVQRALLAITQIKSKGRLQAEEMLQLQEAGISSELVYDALAKRLGKTRAELTKLQQAGKIDATTGLEAILEAVRHKTGTSQAGEAALKNTTMDASLRRLRGSVFNAFADIGQAAEPELSRLLARVPLLFEELAASPAVRDFGHLLLSRLVNLRLWVDANWGDIKGAVVAGAELMTDALRLQADALRWTADHWSGLKIALYAIAIPLGIVAAGGLLLLAPLYLVATAVGAVAWAFVKAADYASENWTKITTSVSAGASAALAWLVGFPRRFYDAGTQLVLGVVGGVTDSVGALVDAVSGLGQSALDALRAVWRSHSPAEAFADVGFDAGLGTVKGVQASIPLVEGATAELGGAAVRAASEDGASAPFGSPRGVTFAPVFHVHQQTGQSIDELAEELAARVRRDFEAWLEGEALSFT